MRDKDVGETLPYYHPITTLLPSWLLFPFLSPVLEYMHKRAKIAFAINMHPSGEPLRAQPVQQ